VKEIRFHGRGGQGAVTAAELLARAAIFDGKYAHSFPLFGSERRGAPVSGFTRISDTPIRTREQIYEPDYVVVLDPALHMFVNVAQGLRSRGLILVNTKESPHEIAHVLKTVSKVYAVDATGIAIEVLKHPITNTVILGALAKTSGLISLDALRRAIIEKFPASLGQANLKAAEVAYEKVLQEA